MDSLHLYHRLDIIKLWCMHLVEVEVEAFALRRVLLHIRLRQHKHAHEHKYAQDRTKRGLVVEALSLQEDYTLHIEACNLTYGHASRSTVEAILISNVEPGSFTIAVRQHHKRSVFSSSPLIRFATHVFSDHLNTQGRIAKLLFLHREYHVTPKMNA